MKIWQFLIPAALVLTGCDAPTKPIDAVSQWQGQVREAVDRRDASNAVLGQAVEAGYVDALRQWGHIGADACPLIRPHLATKDSATQVAALKGLAHCRDTGAFNEIAALTGAPNEEVRIAAFEALGFTATEETRSAHVDLVAAALDGDASESEKAAAIYGLMQSITYSGLTPADLPGLDIEKLLEFAGKPSAAGDEAAYLLTRLRGLDGLIDPQRIYSAITPETPKSQVFLLARVLRGLGNEAAEGLMAFSEGRKDGLADQRVAVAAIRALGQMSDPETRSYLLALLIDAEPHFQQLALSALAGRADADELIVSRLRDFAEDSNAWLSVTALEGLVGQGDAAAIEKAAEWVEAGSFYKAFRAIGMLNGSDEGKALLQAYAEANPTTVRGRMAASTLDPSTATARAPRPTIPYTEAAKSAGKRIVLSTTQGDIVIEMIEGAPYAASAFLDYAKDGVLDGMIWHRVIPGFVAQAGQKDTLAQFDTPTIREEWGAARHEPGTVGVATAGPDTGTAQFFINLETNRHLDGRYTVFGRVVEGMDLAYALQEGDAIIDAIVE